MDLNNPPPEFDYDFLDTMFQEPTDAAEPIFCTQQLPKLTGCTKRKLRTLTETKQTTGRVIAGDHINFGLIELLLVN